MLRRLSVSLFGLVALATGCGGSAATSPSAPSASVPPQDVVDASPKAPTAPQPRKEESPAERHARQAREFEERGVLDRAAYSWLLSDRKERDVKKVWRAARLLEEALNFPSARECYQVLGDIPQEAADARAALKRLGEEGGPEDPKERKDGAATQVWQVRRELTLDGLEAALDRLNKPAFRWSLAAWILRGEIEWKLGNHKRAQQAWSRARSFVSPLALMGVPLTVVSSLGHHQQNVVVTDQAVYFTTVDGTLTLYDPVLDTFSHGISSMDDRSSWNEFEEDAHLSEARVSSTMSLAKIWTFIDVKYPRGLGQPHGAAVSPAGDHFAWQTNRHELVLFSAATEPLRQVEFKWKRRLGGQRFTRSAMDHAVAFSSDGKQIFAGTLSGEVVVYDLAGNELKKWAAHEGGQVVRAATSADGQWLATFGRDAKIKVWNLANGKLERAIKLPVKHPITSLTFFPNSDTLEYSSAATLRRVEWKTGTETAHTQLMTGILQVDHSPHGEWMVIGPNKSESLFVYRGKELEGRPVNNRQVPFVTHATSADSSTLAVSSRAGTTVFDIATWKSRDFHIATSRIALSDDGLFLAAVVDKSVAVFDAHTGKRLWKLDLPSASAQVRQMEFVSKTKLLVNIDQPRLYDARTQEITRVGGEKELYERLGTGWARRGEDGWRLFNAADRPIKKLPCTKDLELWTSPDRSYIACIDESLHLIVLDAAGEELRDFGIVGYVRQAKVSNDAQTLVAEIEGELHMYDFETNRWSGGGDAQQMSGMGLSFIGDDWLASSGSDGVRFMNVAQPTGPRGWLHVLQSGQWFSIVQNGHFQQTDGAAEAVDSFAFLNEFDRIAFEALRVEGSMATLLAGELSTNWSIDEASLAHRRKGETEAQK